MKQTALQLADIPLPGTEDLERQVIADAINNQDVIGDVSLIISEDSFTEPGRKLIWKTIMDMYAKRETIDLVSIHQKTGKVFIEEILSHSTETCFADGFFSHANLLHVAETKRRAYFAALTILQQSASSQTSEEDIFTAAEGLSRKIQGERQSNSETPLTTVLGMVANETEAMQQDAMHGKATRIPTSLPSLDYALYGGFGPGQLIILAARPSVGKTALMLQFAKCAAEHKTPAVVFSMEMTREELGKRLLFSTGFISQADMIGKNVKWQQFESARGVIDSLPLYINTDARTPEAIAARLTSIASQGRCGIAMIDYLGLMRFSIGGSRNSTLSEQIGNATRELKALAMRLKIPIVLLCQLNRDMSKDSTAPQLFHLRDSGNIEQDADIVLMLAQNGRGNNIDMWIRKNRNFLRDIKLELMPNETYTKFYETGSPDWVKTQPAPPSYIPQEQQQYNGFDNEPF